MSDTPETAFAWIHVANADALEQFYLGVLPNIRTEARAHGYAVGLHGSWRRDLDLIAVPWVTDHSGIDELAAAIQQAALGPPQNAFSWVKKPCGRIATSLPVCWLDYDDPRPSAGHIDLSVITPLLAASSGQREVALRCAEPTEEMLLAARDWSYEKYGKPIGDDAARGCWKAMYVVAAMLPADEDSRPKGRSTGKFRLVYNKATKRIDQVSNFTGLAVDSFDPPTDWE